MQRMGGPRLCGIAHRATATLAHLSGQALIDMRADTQRLRAIGTYTASWQTMATGPGVR
jgi:hypothetical protein